MAEYLNLENLGRGVVLEKFDEALQQVLENIDDPNCSLKAKRKITIDIEFKPIAKGKACTYAAEVKVKLAPQSKHEGTITTGKIKGGAYVASESDLDQEEMDFSNNVTEMKGDKK